MHKQDKRENTYSSAGAKVEKQNAIDSLQNKGQVEVRYFRITERALSFFQTLHPQMVLIQHISHTFQISSLR